MSKQEILFVAYRDEQLEEGASYALYLANLLGEALRVVLLNRKDLSAKLDDLMTAVTFAEANEHGTARQTLSGEKHSREAVLLQNYLMQKCESEGVKATVHIGLEATASVVVDFLRQKKIDIVLLSPSVTNSGNILKRLLRLSPRPIITMAQGADYSEP